MENQELTLLSEEEICGEGKLDVLKKYGLSAGITDLVILTGGSYKKNASKERLGNYWLKNSLFDSDRVNIIRPEGDSISYPIKAQNICIRPVIKNPAIITSRNKGDNNTSETIYGEYPQFAPPKKIQDILKIQYACNKLNRTGNSYTFNSTPTNSKKLDFTPVTYEEYSFQDKRYIRVKANFHYVFDQFTLSNGLTYKNGDYVWIEVLPIIWLVDDETNTLISKNCLVAGIPFLDEGTSYDGNYNKITIKKYMDKHMNREILQKELKLAARQTPKETESIKYIQKKPPCNFNFDKVSEDEIIRGAIESNIAVFLHGPSSEGKSARVKQIDSDCEIVYLRNASPESLNGKSVYNAETGEMIDIKPSWLKKLEEKCEKEPDKLHILFFDEITNAMPSIQGIAFNIILDKEVNGIWKLPSNARIVAAGNDMLDSLAANELAEPLFNRFAHVYIKTTTKAWLKWASENNIHPAIYAYIAFKNGKVLRRKYDGKKPNADPRKWEMASKMLYATGKPEMLRALIGEDITNEFIQFCNQKVISLEDVLDENYGEVVLETLNIAEKYATTMGLTMVDDDNLKTVRDFVKKLGAEFTAIFDDMWAHGDAVKQKKIEELKHIEEPNKIKK